MELPCSNSCMRLAPRKDSPGEAAGREEAEGGQVWLLPRGGSRRTQRLALHLELVDGEGPADVVQIPPFTRGSRGSD